MLPTTLTVIVLVVITLALTLSFYTRLSRIEQWIVIQEELMAIREARKEATT